MIPSPFYHESAEYIAARLSGFRPDVLLILGSGLGFMAEQMEDAAFIDYKDIPHFKRSTAPGHQGRLAAGTYAGKNLLMMQGRLHVYEGYTPEEAAYPVRVASLLGAQLLIVTCACGGVNTSYQVGDLAVLTDILNFTRTGPLVGFDIANFPTRFVDMSQVFNPAYRALAHQVADRQRITLRDGVYFYMPGPQFETPAEIRAIRTLGGDLVGMSCVHECVTARRCGMDILGIALVSNMAAGIGRSKSESRALDRTGGMSDAAQPITEGEVLVEARKAAARFSLFITEVLEAIG